jgi:hypothetical protein
VKTLGTAKTTALAAATLALTAGAAAAESTAVYTGFEVAEDSYTLYAGAVRALNNDINTNGLLLRFSAAYGEYEYNTVAVAGGKVDIDGTSADLMLGYQWVGASSIAAAYFGVDYRDNDLTPFDPTNRTSGDEVGAKAQFELHGASGSGLIASYSTANETYFTRGRLGVSLGALHAGPEVSFLGDKGYDAYKVGAFLGGIQLGQTSSLTINAGYMDADGNSSSDGGYLGASMSFKF